MIDVLAALAPMLPSLKILEMKVAFGALAVATALACAPPARAADVAPASTTPVTQIPSGWSFSVKPYVWLPKIDGTLNYKLPSQVGGTANVDAAPTNYLSGLNFAGMVAGEARYDRFSILTDLIYVNLSNGASRLRSGNFAAVPSNPVTGTGSLDTSSRLGAGVFSLAGGYTILQGDWGNLDGLAGVRLVNVNARTNYASSVVFSGPNGGTATLFGADGGLSTSKNIWNGFAGVRGKLAIGTSKFFVPYYADIGAGDSNLTWQLATGIGYRTSFADLSLGWRYLAFDQGSGSVIKNLSLNGPYLAAEFRF